MVVRKLENETELKKVSTNLQDIQREHVELPVEITGEERAVLLLRILKGANIHNDYVQEGKRLIASLTNLPYAKIVKLAQSHPYREKSILRPRNSDEKPTELNPAEVGKNKKTLSNPDYWDKERILETQIRRAIYAAHLQNEKLNPKELAIQLNTDASKINVLKKLMQIEGIIK